MAMALLAWILPAEAETEAEEKHPFLLNPASEAPYDKKRVALYFSSDDPTERGIACSILRRSALAGNYDAATELSRRYRIGDVLSQDNLKAAYWINFAILLAWYDDPQMRKHIDQAREIKLKDKGSAKNAAADSLFELGYEKVLSNPSLRPGGEEMKLLKGLSDQEFQKLDYWLRYGHPPLC